MTDYRLRLQRALSFIGEHLDGPIRLEEVAKAAALSEHHFHRVFRACLDETVGQYITRKRLETAALALAYQPDRAVTEIALTVGYSSPSNFSKAFSAFFGCSPSAVRTPTGASARIGTLMKRYGKDFDPAALHVAPELPESRERLEQVRATQRFEHWDARHLVCMTSPGGYDVSAVMQTWGTLIGTVLQLRLSGQDVDAYAITHDDPAVTAADRCRYDAGVRVAAAANALPSPLFVTTLPAGRYAIFGFRGNVADVPETYRDIYALWFASVAVLPDGPPPVEHYIHDAPDPQGNVDMEIAIKVRPSRS